MLVLSRKTGETIIVDDRIKIHIIEVRCGRVRIGIEAPSEVSIHREELVGPIFQQRARDEMREKLAEVERCHQLKVQKLEKREFVSVEHMERLILLGDGMTSTAELRLSERMAKRIAKTILLSIDASHASDPARYSAVLTAET